MAISPPSDIVLDVARAADPETYRVAAERLARLRAVAPANQDAFATSLAREQARVAPRPADATPAVRNQAAAGRRRLDAYGQFEAFVLQTFVQSMLPKGATNVFGKGSAGEFWRSMLAEKVGHEVAASGQVGIARRLAAGAAARPPAGSALAAVAPPPAMTPPTQPAADAAWRAETVAETTAETRGPIEERS